MFTPYLHRSLVRVLLRCAAACALALTHPWLTAADTPQTLREAAGDELLIGCPVGIMDLDNPKLLDLIAREFSTITVHTEMMPFKLGVNRDAFDFEPADRILDWAEENNLPVLGHMLVWDYKTPSWLFQDENGDPLPREKGLENLRFYIHTVMNHFKGRIMAWNVVNEAISDEPGEYLRDTLARRSIGDDYVERAFAFAEEADPDVELYYNDYSVIMPEKREKTLRLVRSLREAGRRVDYIGMQGHWLIDRPASHLIDSAVEAFAAEGFKVMFTELDIDVLPRTVSGANMQTVDDGPDPFTDGLPYDWQLRLAGRYHAVFSRMVKHPSVVNITFWGSHDGRSWLNYFPVTTRTNHPLLFDRELKRKPAHGVVLQAFEEAMIERAARESQAVEN